MKRLLPLLLVSLLSCRSTSSAEQKTAAASSTQTEQKRLPAPAHLPETARQALWSKMQGHGQDMSQLLLAVLFLDHESAQEIASFIATEPRLTRPTNAEADTVNALLPRDFFDLQDDLAAKAKKMAEIAARPDHDSVAIAQAYGDVAATCVRCHTTYMFVQPAEDEWAIDPDEVERDVRVESSSGVP